MKYSSNERAGQMVYNNLADQQTKPKDVKEIKFKLKNIKKQSQFKK